MTEVTKDACESLPGGGTVEKFQLKSESVTMEIISLGCIITALKTKDKTGKINDIVLGFDNPEGGFSVAFFLISVTDLYFYIITILVLGSEMEVHTVNRTTNTRTILTSHKDWLYFLLRNKSSIVRSLRLVWSLSSLLNFPALQSNCNQIRYSILLQYCSLFFCSGIVSTF